jgi:hypothetical protein
VYYDTTRLTPLRIAEAQRQADLERLVRAVPETAPTPALPIDTRAAGEPIAAAAPLAATTATPTEHVAPATAPVSPPVPATAVGECGDCRTADQAA